MQRIPYTQLSLAIDIQQQRPVVIRDIDIQQIDVSSRPHIFKALQQEYDVLRQNNSKDVLPLVSSFYTQNHLYSISTWPLTTLPQKSGHEQTPRIYTLEDLLQSGIGLPDKQTAVYWILRLAKTIEYLHRNNLVIGTLDPSTILLSQKDYGGRPILFPSWILPAVQSQMQQVSNTVNGSYLSLIPTDRTAFFSPEAKQGQPEMRSDVYSMGAILYLLVTGIAPAEQSITASQQLRSPRKINPQVQNTLATAILKALSREPSERFQSANEFAAVLQQEQSKVPQRYHLVFFGQNRSAEKVATDQAEINFTSDRGNNKTGQGKVAQADLATIDDTIRVAPHELTRHYLSHIITQKLGQERLNPDHEELMPKNVYSEKATQAVKEEMGQIQNENPAPVVGAVAELEDETSLQNTSENTAFSSQEEEPGTQTTIAEQKLNDSIAIPVEGDTEHIAITEPAQQNDAATEVPADNENTPLADSSATSLSPLPPEMLEQDKRKHAKRPKIFSALLERAKRFFLGGQPRINSAVALIETPMRIRPNMNYTIRIHVIGRNEPKRAPGSKQSNGAARLGGLGSLKHGEQVHIEVRSALYNNYAYIVQQTDVEVPAHNYAAEVTLPMRSITDRSGTRRERLHIFFTDEKRNPLYEEPFLVELFISNLVQPGHEGHNVLSIPL
jgi:serine/threonine protein kinase